jgi:hypothetical protein
MKYETKFVSASDASRLTEIVNAQEKEGWEFVSVQLALSPSADPATQQCNYFVLMLATLRRTATMNSREFRNSTTENGITSYHDEGSAG